MGIKVFLYKKRIFLFKSFVIMASIALFFIIGELYLKYAEKRHMDYANPQKGSLGKAGFLKENFDEFVVGGHYGSKVRWKNNSAGFRSDREFSEKPMPGVLRILSMGDSFTAGYRVGQEETFSFLLEKWIQSKYGKAEVLISAIEEPVYGLEYLKSFGQFYHPHIAFLGITLGNDIAQSLAHLGPEGVGFKHGLEKYEIPKQCLNTINWVTEALLTIKSFQRRSRILNMIFNQSSAIASWYGEFKNPKLFDALNGLGNYLKSSPHEIDEAYHALFKTLLAYKAFCQEKGILFVVAIFPQRFQLQPDDWDRTVNAYRLKESCFNLQLPNIRIMRFCEENSIRCIDPTDAMAQEHQKNGKSLYFQRGDMHWNKFGHRAFFKSIQGPFSKIIVKALDII